MQFSVLMSVYEKEKPNFLKSAIDSILNQSIKPDEIVIVKDGKLTKELDNIINSYAEQNPNLFNIVELLENKGLGTALAIGVEQCKNEIIARMDTDDICVYNRFEKQLEIFKNNPNIAMVGSCIDEFEGDIINKISVRTVPENNQDIISYAKTRNPFNHMTVMYKKSKVIKAGNYKPFLWNEDYYLWVRMIVDKNEFYNIQESLVYVRAGNEMFERRGSFEYAKQDLRLQKEFYKLGFINKSQAISNSIKRSVVRVIPNKLRKLIYLKLLRN